MPHQLSYWSGQWEKRVPGEIGALPALAGPQAGVAAVPVEVAADEAGVVEHPVQQHPHPPQVGLAAQGGKVPLRAQHGVHLLIVPGAVPVVLRPLEDGAEVEGLHPQPGQKVQLLRDPRKTAAEEVPVADLPVPVGAVLRLLLPALVDGAPPHHPRGVRDHGAPEAVGEDLIGDPLSEPGGHLLTAVIDGELMLPPLPAPAVQPLQAEGVPHQTHIVPGVQLPGEHIPVPLPPRPGEGDGHRPVPPELEPGGEKGAGKALCPGRAEGEGHPRPRRHRAVGALAAGIPGVEYGGVFSHGHAPFSGSGSPRRRRRPGCPRR